MTWVKDKKAPSHKPPPSQSGGIKQPPCIEIAVTYVDSAHHVVTLVYKTWKDAIIGANIQGQGRWKVQHITEKTRQNYCEF